MQSKLSGTGYQEHPQNGDLRVLRHMWGIFSTEDERRKGGKITYWGLGWSINAVVDFSRSVVLVTAELVSAVSRFDASSQ